jgi:hypothetical protein
MRTLPSSLRSRLLRRPPPSHGPKSGFYLFSCSRNLSHPRSFILSHQRSVTFCILVPFLHVYTLKFVRNVGITHGDESRVGLYVGMSWSRSVLPYYIALSSTLYSSPRRPLQSCTGVGSLILSAVSQPFSSDFSAYHYRCLDLASQLLIGALLCGTYPSL